MTGFLICGLIFLGIDMVIVIAACAAAPLWDNECEYLYPPVINKKEAEEHAMLCCAQEENEDAA